MFFLARQILIGELICTVLCNPIYKPTGKQTKQLPVPEYIVEQLLASSRQLQHTCDGPECLPHFPAATGLPPGHRSRGALTSGSEQLVSKFKRTYSPNLAGAQLYISCDVTKTGGKFRLTNAFQSTGFLFCLCCRRCQVHSAMSTV